VEIDLMVDWLELNSVLEDCRCCSGFFFFFQAEDGIRDGHVTGVQTCALPISCPSCRWFPASFVQSCTWNDYSRRPSRLRRTIPRSEERRVGKECRSRRSPYH